MIRYSTHLGENLSGTPQDLRESRRDIACDPVNLLATKVRFRCQEPSLSKVLTLLDASMAVFVDAVGNLF